MRASFMAFCAFVVLLVAMGKLATFSKQAIAADQGILIQGADYNLTIVTAYSSDLASVAENVTQGIVIEYADFNAERGLNSSGDLGSIAAGVTPAITVEYADYSSTNELLTYLGPNNGSNTVKPSINITRIPSGDVTSNQSVTVSAEVYDAGSGVKNATLEYNLDNGASWVDVPMNLNVTVQPKDSLLLSYYGEISNQSEDTYVRLRVVAWDYAENSATADAPPYTVVPEFPSTIILTVFMAVALVAVTVYRRKVSRFTA
jgi:hypothetical protein